MPEEKKKESFTFSDKIKNSKPVASKSFANRISSKIGSDGKPKKTLFERTKRDAPFFIAALVALLLLPFLYKYSGQISEEPLVTPASEESIFDPERYGFDTVTGDPDGQIAQLAGRDPLSLIKGFGYGEEEPDDALYDLDSRSGLDDYRSYSGTSVEENNTNIYKKNAAPATRAAFRRAATKINPLASAGLTSRGGGKLGVGMWGGGLKSAAQKVADDTPRSSPKPVSLQPLQAAGKPSRSYFGQGAAAEARRSKDAMSKANAMQALMDAQMKPIEPGRIGGLGSDSFGPGGGSGELKRGFTFNGKEPWWWDMMKTRSQMEWEAKFNRKWDWIKWGDKILQNLFSGIASCLITGTDDWSMGKMGWVSAGAGSPDKCGEFTAEDWKNCSQCMAISSTMDKGSCYILMQYKGGSDSEDPWKPGNKNSVSMGPLAQRMDCLSNGLGARLASWWKRRAGKNVGAFAERGDCNTFAVDGQYYANFSSTRDGWTILHYVVGIPTNRLEQYYEMTPEQQAETLVIGYIDKGAQFNSNIASITKRSDFVPLFVESVAIKDKKIKKIVSSPAGENPQAYSYKGYWGTDRKNRKGAFSAKTYQEAVEKCKSLKRPIRGDCLGEIDQQAEERLEKSKRMLAMVNNESLPTYADFLDMLRSGGIVRDAVGVGAKENLAVSTKKAKEGKDWVTGARCPYPLVRVSCDYLAVASQQGQKEGGYPFAHLTFTNGMTGEQAYNTMKSRFLLSYTVQGQDNSQPNAITTSTDPVTGQWFYIPHQNVRPFNGTWNEEMTQAGFVTRGLGTERKDLPGKGNDYQIVATTPDLMRYNQDRLIITWEVRQCDSLATDGSSITKGGCNKGNILVRDGKGNATGSAGQDKPGIRVSEATCIYSGVYEPIGIETDIKPNPNPRPDPEPDPNPETDPAPRSEDDPVSGTFRLANVMNGVGGISDLFEKQRAPYFSFPSFNVYGKGGKKDLASALNANSCLSVGQIAEDTKSAVVFDQASVKSYVDQVLAQANNNKALQAELKKFEHTGDVTVPQLADALVIAYALDPKATVPLNVVCALGKTIGHNAYDRGLLKDPRVWRNIFGAFAAYIGPDSSYYPALYVPLGTGKIIDQRFFGCGTAEEGGQKKSAKQNFASYHYGRYNWSHLKNGDLAEGGTSGRDPYLKVLEQGGWVADASNPYSYPLYAIAKAVNFQRENSVTAAQVKNYNNTIDDYNRSIYTRAYASVLSDTNQNASCGLSGEMQVADALRYLGGVCINGKEAKPSHGHTSDFCQHNFKRSAESGTATHLEK